MRLAAALQHPDAFPCAVGDECSCSAEGAIPPGRQPLDAERKRITVCPIKQAGGGLRSLVNEALHCLALKQLPTAGGTLDQPAHLMNVIKILNNRRPD